MKYVMIFYAYDVNYILGAPTKNRSEAEFLRVYKEFYSELQSKCFKPHFNKMDNEASVELQEFIRSQKVEVQFARPKCIDRMQQNVMCERGILFDRNPHKLTIRFPHHELMPAHPANELYPEPHAPMPPK